MLIIDSGIGGLSVLNNIKKNFPNINYIYMLDNEGFPYGKKKKKFLIERSIKIINIIKEIYPIKMVIIACNTISTISLPILRKTFNIPIIGILPIFKPAIEITKNKTIGLIATRATVNSSYIKKNIYKYSFQKTIKVIATNELAIIAEKKFRKIFISNVKLREIFQSWTVLSRQPDTIILGCTHFSFLKKEIQKIFYKPINFIDSGETIVNKIKKYSYQKKKKKIFFYALNTKKKYNNYYFF
ncbi:glutamate racemase [Buchnera aphidicola]|uniref:glutamate racemase n=1 Tax=Buchnera aphidicola TaxID=9 RepID=UPI0021C2FE17|nr:glutamate racemase [Buchnera aphidicola]